MLFHESLLVEGKAEPLLTLVYLFQALPSVLGAWSMALVLLATD